MLYKTKNRIKILRRKKTKGIFLKGFSPFIEGKIGKIFVGKFGSLEMKRSIFLLT
jgi:hypothetical protein